jgi:hypothetical protein
LMRMWSHLCTAGQTAAASALLSVTMHVILP